MSSSEAHVRFLKRDDANVIMMLNHITPRQRAMMLHLLIKPTYDRVKFDDEYDVIRCSNCNYLFLELRDLEGECQNYKSSDEEYCFSSYCNECMESCLIDIMCDSCGKKARHFCKGCMENDRHPSTGDYCYDCDQICQACELYQRDDMSRRLRFARRFRTVGAEYVHEECDVEISQNEIMVE